MSIQVMNEEGKAVRLITPRAGKTPGQVQILTEVAAGIVLCRSSPSTQVKSHRMLAGKYI